MICPAFLVEEVSAFRSLFYFRFTVRAQRDLRRVEKLRTFASGEDAQRDALRNVADETFDLAGARQSWQCQLEGKRVCVLG